MSWHASYDSSAYVYVGGLHEKMTEGDVITIMSQFGEVIDAHLVRDDETGASKCFAFVAYEDQRSTVLAVDNFAGVKLLGKTLKVATVLISIIHILLYEMPTTFPSDAK